MLIALIYANCDASTSRISAKYGLEVGGMALQLNIILSMLTFL